MKRAQLVLGTATAIAFAATNAFAAPTPIDFSQINNFGSNPGDLKMFVHVPADMPDNAPVVVALHGCNQNGKALLGNPGEMANATGHASAFAKDSDWSKLADKYKFYVIYPEQTVRVTNVNDANKVNNDYGCFNWAGFFGENFGRGTGETGSVMSMIDYVKSNYSVNNELVYVTGLSAGGALTNTLLAHYPDVFAGGAPMAGIAYDCATYDGQTGATVKSRAFSCMGVDSKFKMMAGGMPENLKRSPQQWGDLVRADGPAGYSGPYPKVIVWQGTADNYVDYDQLTEIMEQWTNVNGVDQSADNSNKRIKAADANHTYEEYADATGEVRVATVSINGMQHGIVTDPGTAEDQGGRAGTSASGVQPFAAWAHDKNVFSSYYTAKFWGLLDWQNQAPGEPIPPTLSISSPANNATVSGNVPVSATVSSEDPVLQVSFSVDGSLKSTDATAPYSYDLNTITLTNGSHIISATATSSNGTSATTSVTVNVNNVTDPGNGNDEVSITSPANADIVSGPVAVTINASAAAGINRVELSVDGSLVASDTSAPYAFNWDSTTVADGIRNITATMFDANGVQMSASVLVIVKQEVTPPPADDKPVVTITGPSNGASVLGSVAITATASDDVGVNRVEFYADGNMVGSDTSAPYSATWNTSGLAAGTYTIQVTAFDSANQTSSQSISVKIDPIIIDPPPPSEECKEWTMINYWHAFSGRVARKSAYWSTYEVVGSGEDVGFGWVVTTIHSNQEGVYANGACP